MTSRTARFVAGGAVVVTTVALLYERTLPYSEYVYRRKNGPWIHEPPRAQVFGFGLSPTEAVVWFTILGVLAGGLFGFGLARVLLMSTSVRSSVSGVVLGGAVGLAVSLAQDTYCIGGGDVFACPYKGLLGWDAMPILADAIWATLGAVVGFLLGLLAAFLARRHQSEAAG